MFEVIVISLLCVIAVKVWEIDSRMPKDKTQTAGMSGWSQIVILLGYVFFNPWVQILTVVAGIATWWYFHRR